MLVIWLTFLGELEDDEKNLLYVAVSRAKKSLRLSQKIVNLIHLQKVLSLITMLSCELLLFGCLFPLQMQHVFSKKEGQLKSVFRISYLCVASSNRSILALNIKEILYLKLCVHPHVRVREKGVFNYFLTLESVLRDRFVRIRVNRRAIWRKTILFQVKMNACGGFCLAQPKWSNYKYHTPTHVLYSFYQSCIAGASSFLIPASFIYSPVSSVRAKL